MSPHTLERRNQLEYLSLCSHEEWNQMQSQEDEAAITEQDLELIKERETAIRQLEVRGRLWLLFGLGICSCLEIFCWISMKRNGLSLCVLCIIYRFSYDKIELLLCAAGLGSQEHSDASSNFTSCMVSGRDTCIENSKADDTVLLPGTSWSFPVSATAFRLTRVLWQTLLPVV